MKISRKDFNFIAFVIYVLYFNLGDSDDEPDNLTVASGQNKFAKWRSEGQNVSTPTQVCIQIAW